MSDEASNVAQKIARAYRSIGIPAKVHQRQLFIERPTGWEGPLEPGLVEAALADDLRVIEADARHALARLIEGLESHELELLGQGSEFLELYAIDPERYRRLGFDERQTRLFVGVVSSLRLWEKLGESDSVSVRSYQPSPGRGPRPVSASTRQLRGSPTGT